MYDPTIGRFFVQDRYAEKYLSFTPYQYGANNPIKYIDNNGDSVWVTSTSNLEDFGNGTSRTTVTHTIHITGKVLDASDSYVDVDEVAAGIEVGLNALGSSNTTRWGDNTFVTKISVEAQIEVAQSMDDVADSDHLITIVDNVLGGADPKGGGGNAGGLGAMFGKISYIESSSFGSAGMISSGIHEFGHNMGLSHDFTNPSNHMSYSSERSGLNFGQLESVVNSFYEGKQNQGPNYSVSGSSSRNTLWHNSTNQAPYDFNVSRGQRIPHILVNTTK